MQGGPKGSDLFLIIFGLFFKSLSLGSKAFGLKAIGLKDSRVASSSAIEVLEIDIVISHGGVGDRRND